MALFGFSFSQLSSFFQNLFGSLGQLVNSFKNGVTNTLHFWDHALHLKDSVLEEIDAWKNFKQDVRFKQRVISLESAIDKTRDLIQGIPDAWHSIIDIVKQVKEKISESSPEAATTELENDFKAATESGGLKNLVEKFPRIARAFEKFVGIAAVIFQAAESADNVIMDLQTIVDELRRIRLEIEKLDTIFLSQSNKRKTLKLADGSSIKIRIGHLHSAEA